MPLARPAAGGEFRKRNSFSFIRKVNHFFISPYPEMCIRDRASDAAWDSLKEDTIVLSVINNYYTAGQKKLAEEYMELHPETKVVVDVVSDNDAYMTKMQTAFSADQNDAPDICLLYTSRCV